MPQGERFSGHLGLPRPIKMQAVPTAPVAQISPIRRETAVACTAPGSLDTRERSERALSGDIQIAPPSLKIDPRGSTALDHQVRTFRGVHAALRGAAARA